MKIRCIGRHLGIHHRTVALWFAAEAENLETLPMPEEIKETKMDELLTFQGKIQRSTVIIHIHVICLLLHTSDGM